MAWLFSLPGWKWNDNNNTFPVPVPPKKTHPGKDLGNLWWTTFDQRAGICVGAKWLDRYQELKALKMLKRWRCWCVDVFSFFLRIFFDVLEKSGDTIHICRIGFKRHLFVSSFFFFCSMCFLFIGLTPNRLTQREHSKVENVFFVVAPLHFFILDNIVSYFDFLLFYPFSENFSTKQPRKTYHHLGKTAAERRVWGDLRLMKRRHEAFVPSVATTWGPEPKGRTGSTATRAPSRERRTAKRRCTK